MKTAYDTDIIARANEQAAPLRAGKFSQLDIEPNGDEVLDVGKSKRRDPANRMAVLLAHLLKLQALPERRGKSWQGTLREQRRMIEGRLRKTPSLKRSLAGAEGLRDAWPDAGAKAFEETNIEDFPENCSWSMDQIRDRIFILVTNISAPAVVDLQANRVNKAAAGQWHRNGMPQAVTLGGGAVRGLR